MNDFLPKGYEVPVKTGSYIEPKDGDVKFRILGSPLIGYKAWKEKKPVRKPTLQELEDHGYDPEGKFGKQVPKHFWALPIYNRDKEEIQILEITQKSIMQSLIDLVENEDYGNPQGYDVTLKKTGENKETKYSIIPSPPKAIEKEIMEEFDAMNINLEVMYKGENPFGFEDTEDDTSIDNIPA